MGDDKIAEWARVETPLDSDKLMLALTTKELEPRCRFIPDAWNGQWEIEIIRRAGAWKQPAIIASGKGMLFLDALKSAIEVFIEDEGTEW